MDIEQWLAENPFSPEINAKGLPPAMEDPDAVDQEQVNDFDIDQFLKDNPFTPDVPTSGDTRQIGTPDQVIPADKREQGLYALGGGIMEAASEIPLAIGEWASTPFETAEYVPGELRSSTRDKIRGERFAQQEFSEHMAADPYTESMSQIGYGIGTVADPIMDTGIAAAPMALRGLRGLPGLADEAGEMIGKKMAQPQAGNIELPTPSHGQDRFMRGGLGQEVDVPANTPILPIDGVPSVQQAITKAENMRWLEPEMIDDVKPARYSPDYAVADEAKEGTKDFLGNMKMRQGNPSWEKGRQTLDYEGCGRGKFCTDNQLLADACYGGDCYAASFAARYGRDVMQTSFPPLRDPEKLGEIARVVEEMGAEKAAELYPGMIVNHYEKLPKAQAKNITKINQSIDDIGLEETQKAFPQFTIKGKDDIGKVTVRQKPIEQGARVTKNIKPGAIKGQDLRLGVDSDGGAWVSNPEVMDAILKGDPKTVSVYSSAYHTPPPAHPLADRAIINVTVSGWHPLPETLKRIEYARQARANGWNTILREVTADPQLFGKEFDKDGINKVERYNRTHDLIRNTDFYIMEQPLHEGARYGKALDDKMPACCKGGDCSACEVAEGTGKHFFDYWGIKEDKPLFKSDPSWTENRDRLQGLIDKKKGLTRPGDGESSFIYRPNFDGKPEEMLINPSGNDIRSYLKTVNQERKNSFLNPEESILRWAKDAEGNIYFADSNKFIHNQMLPEGATKVDSGAVYTYKEARDLLTKNS